MHELWRRRDNKIAVNIKYRIEIFDLIVIQTIRVQHFCPGSPTFSAKKSRSTFYSVLNSTKTPYFSSEKYFFLLQDLDAL